MGSDRSNKLLELYGTVEVRCLVSLGGDVLRDGRIHWLFNMDNGASGGIDEGESVVSLEGIGTLEILLKERFSTRELENSTIKKLAMIFSVETGLLEIVKVLFDVS